MEPMRPARWQTPTRICRLALVSLVAVGYASDSALNASSTDQGLACNEASSKPRESRSLLPVLSTDSRSSGPQPEPEENGDIKFVTAFSVECKSYHDWQSVTLYYSWRQAGLPGKLVRIVACSPDRQAQSKTFSDLQGFETHFHNRADSDYLPLNKPWGFLSWLKEGGGRTLPPNAVIMIVDPDMVFYRAPLEVLTPMIERVHSGATQAIGSDFEYIVNGLQAKSWALARYFGITDVERLQSIGVPMLLRKESLTRLARPYYEIAKAISRSSSLTSLVHDGNLPAPWIAEMVAYTLATAWLRHETQKQWPALEAPQPPFNATSDHHHPLLVHYDHGFLLCGRPFGKFRYMHIDLLDCSANASVLASLHPPSRAEVNSNDCDLCIENGEISGWPATCDLPAREFSIFIWEQVHGAVYRWRLAHCA